MPLPPATITPTVVIEPADPGWSLDRLHVTDLTLGYRHEERTEGGLDGFALRVVWGEPDSGLEIEWMPSGAWGADGLGNFEMSLGLRYAVNKAGHVRPFAVIAPVASFVRPSSDAMDTFEVGANAGLGVDIDLPAPGVLSFDVRAGQTLATDTLEASGWQVMATASIGLHVPRAIQRTPAGR